MKNWYIFRAKFNFYFIIIGHEVILCVWSHIGCQEQKIILMEEGITGMFWGQIQLFPQSPHLEIP